MQTAQSNFSVGQIVFHLKFEYRGVIFDVDPVYSGSALWYEQVALSRPPKDKPWYHVLVDGTAHSTYVAERHLEADSSGKPIEHPHTGNYFSELKNGFYAPKISSH